MKRALTTHVAYHQVLAAEPLQVELCVACCISSFRWWCCRRRGCRWTGKTDEASVFCGTFSWGRLRRRGHGLGWAAVHRNHRNSSPPFVFVVHSPHYLLRSERFISFGEKCKITFREHFANKVCQIELENCLHTRVNLFKSDISGEACQKWLHTVIKTWIKMFWWRLKHF